MKRKIFMILGLLLTGVILVGCNIEIGGRKSKINKSNGDVNEVISIDGVEKINMEIAVADIDLYAVDGSEVQVSRTCKGDVFGELSVEKNGNTINIIEDEVNYTLGNSVNKNELKIGIPVSYSGDMIMKYALGECEIEELTLNDVEINSGVGDLDIAKGKYNSFTLSQGAGEADIQLSSCGTINMKGGVGDLKVDLQDIQGDFSYKGGVGDTTIYMPNNSPVTFKTDTGVGKCDVEVNTSGEVKYLFDIKTGVGEIRVIGK